MKNNFIFSTTDIIKNKMDTNNYKYVVLQNRLKVLLISDEKADKSGCSLCVNVGSFDETEISGLAHFLEHLLFMGTEKYPDENDYMNFLSMHNGSSNAYTCNDSTVYYFDVSNKYFNDALDRFAQFFIGPLFNKDSVDREISAVNSEFLGTVSNDGNRRERFLQLCYKEELEESRFDCGNSDTLRIKNIREKVIDFYNNKYHPDRMACVVYSNKSIEEMEEIIKIFNDVPSEKTSNNTNNTSLTKYPCTRYNEYIQNVKKVNWYNLWSQYNDSDKIFKEDCVNKLLKLKSIEDTKRLDINIKTLHPNINNLLFDVLIEDILKEDKGCIKILKDLNLAYDMSVYIRPIKYYGIFKISVFLTDKGFENPILVVNEIENFLKNYEMLSSDIQKMVDHNEINFMYREKEDVIDMIEEISDNIMRVPIQNILNYEYLNNKPSKELINEVMDSIRKREEWVFFVSSNSFNLKSKDSIYGIEYEK
ncbi:insulin-degrading enzyme (IDE) [Vairimorpha necatrix]|uniref:Insulin-degrading enzyme (IDE) n=1 Tax=Vairimorpha necatrix TaxID=6039 RepID=A0AAX4JG58_9MICR